MPGVSGEISMDDSRLRRARPQYRTDFRREGVKMPW